MGAADWEADVSPGTIDVTVSSGTNTHTTHAARADTQNWNIAIMVLIQPLPSFHFVMARSATKRSGSENVNGYDTIKYAVDTTHQEPMDKAGYIGGMNVKDYNIVGSAWVTKDTGCMVKFILDFEQDGKDGSVDKTHYEGVITKR